MILSGTNCPAKADNDRSFCSRSSSATQGGQVSWPAMTNIGRPVVEEISNAFSTEVCLVCADATAGGRMRAASKQTVNFMAELMAGLQCVNGGDRTAKLLWLMKVKGRPWCGWHDHSSNGSTRQQSDHFRIPARQNSRNSWILAIRAISCTSIDDESSIAAILLRIASLKLIPEPFHERHRVRERGKPAGEFDRWGISGSSHFNCFHKSSKAVSKRFTKEAS